MNQKLSKEIYKKKSLTTMCCKGLIILASYFFTNFTVSDPEIEEILAK